MTLPEELIRQKLRLAFGACPIIGEEFGGQFDGNGWVIDPIDGTSNVLCGIPLWSISVALMEDHFPVIGAVYSPCMASLVSASRDLGVRVNQRQHARPTPSPVPTYSVGENTIWPIEETRAAIDGLRKSGHEIVRLRSASQSLAMVSRGELEGFVEEHLKLWDIAAGWLLCSEAGVPVTVSGLHGFSRSIWTGAAVQ